MDSPEVVKLRKLCQEWGGDLVELSTEAFDTKFTGKGLRTPRGLYNAPFTHHDLGVDFPRRKVLYSARCGSIDWAEVIHEMGHVFASRVNPEKSKEWDFLGWEWAVCLHIGADQKHWKAVMNDYAVDDNGATDFGRMSPKEQDDLLAERLASAVASGLVASDGTPKCIRVKRRG